MTVVQAIAETGAAAAAAAESDDAPSAAAAAAAARAMPQTYSGEEDDETDYAAAAAAAADDARDDDNNSSHHHHHHAHAHHDQHHGSKEQPWFGMPLYSPPCQRQRWGDHQHHPHTKGRHHDFFNGSYHFLCTTSLFCCSSTFLSHYCSFLYHNIISSIHPFLTNSFFDLFYVAAAYQLGNVLREDPTATGLLYAAGLFFPIQNIWSFKTYYDARFYVASGNGGNGGDYLHAGYELALLLALASAVLHVKPVAILSHPGQYVDMFYFCLSLCLAYLLAAGRLVEVVVGQKWFAGACPQLYAEAGRTCARESMGNFVAGAFYVAAAVYTGMEFYRRGPDHDDDDHRVVDDYSSGYPSYYDSDGYDSKNSTTTTTTTTDEAHHLLQRMLAGGAEEKYIDSSTNPDNVAVWLLLGALFVNILYFLVQVVYFSLNKSSDHKEYMVPMNVDYGIHRYGEWIMLMLGESVLSLLIVDIVETSAYYTVEVDGIITIVLLEYLHFQSQPNDPNKHAIRQSLGSSFVFYWVMQVYSLALIILGTSYKMLLFECLYMEEDYGDDHHRSRRHRNLLGELHDRFLAGGTSAALRFSTEDRQQRVAHFFCGSLALVFFCMDVMSLAHRGFLDNFKKCECAETTPTTKAAAVLLLFLRLAVLLAIATLSQYETDPDQLAVIGLFSVVAQLLLRVAGFYIFPNDSDKDREEEMLERMIQYTAARVHETPADASDSVAAVETSTKNS